MATNILSIAQKHTQTHLKVATLNFSGINISPFEYHDGSTQKNSINMIFRSLLNSYNTSNPNTNWNIAKIDKIFQKQRYTILYHTDCGCIRGRLLTKEQFQIVWDRTFDLNNSIVSHMNLTQQEINMLRNFDYLLYLSFLESIFGKVDLSHLERYSGIIYLEQLKKWHSKAYLDPSTKIDYVKNYIQKQDIDVLFLQQALVSKAKDYLPNNLYTYTKNAQSMIIYKRQTYFMQDHKDVFEFYQKYKDALNFNKDSCFLKSKEMLLISSHLSSKKNNVEQAKQMFEVLEQISKQHKDLKIIVGIDANHPLHKHHTFDIFPHSHAITTRKKRTTLQCQFQKSDKLISESKDFIVTNIPISSGRICTIKSKQITDDLLPNEDHPFDHFVITTNLDFDKPSIRQRSSSFLKNLASPIKILIQQTSGRRYERSFQEIINQLVAHIVPPDAGQPFRGFKNAVPHFNKAYHHSAPKPGHSPINLQKNHDFINWNVLKSDKWNHNI